MTGARLPGGRAAVLAAVLGWPGPGCPTVSDLCAATGFRSKATVHRHLVALRDLGLVDWADGDAGTLHPTVTVVRSYC